MQEEGSNGTARTFPRTGDTITLKASDYFDGNRDLSIRLVHLPDELLHIPSLEWAQVIGVEVFRAGACGPQRIFVIKVETLRRAPRDNLTTWIE